MLTDVLPHTTDNAVPSAQTGTVAWSIRRAVEADATLLGEITVAGWRHAYRGIVPADRLAALDPDTVADVRRELIAAPEPTAVLVAEQSDGVRGHVVVGAPRRPEYAGDTTLPTGELATLYLDPPAIGSGAGAALHDAGVAHLAAAGFRRAVLWAFVGNDSAFAFYARRGWSPDGEPWQAEGWSAPAVRWAKHL